MGATDTSQIGTNNLPTEKATEDGGWPILWNKLGSDEQVRSSEFGVDGELTNIRYAPAQHSDGFAPDPAAYGWCDYPSLKSYVRFKMPFGQDFPDAGTMEFWWLPGHDENASPGYVVFELPWMSFSYEDGTSAIAFGITAVDGSESEYSTTYDLDYSGGEAHHFGVTWDKNWGGDAREAVRGW